LRIAAEETGWPLFLSTRRRRSFQWKQRHAACWLLTEFDDDMTGDKATKEFMTWRPEGAAKKQNPVAGAAALGSLSGNR
jgi:hypothetical protein